MLVNIGAPTVFVVDDDASIRRALGRLLRSAGYQSESFASAEFLHRTEFESPGCILLDIQLPGLSGFKVQEMLAAAARHLAIVFITGYADVPTSVRAMKAGAVDFLPKPFTDEDLLQAVAEALHKSRREQIKQTEVAKVRARLSTLTAREREVLHHVIAGKLNKQAAADLGIVEKTIKVHRSRVMEKMGTRSVAELVMMVARSGLCGPPPITVCDG
jgi:FixJ family two-component response regulator